MPQPTKTTTQPDHKNGRKAEAVVFNEQASEFAGVNELSGGFVGVNGNGNNEYHVTRLNDARFQTGQRQTFALELQKSYGNKLVQRLLENSGKGSQDGHKFFDLEQPARFSNGLKESLFETFITPSSQENGLMRSPESKNNFEDAYIYPYPMVGRHAQEGDTVASIVKDYLVRHVSISSEKADEIIGKMTLNSQEIEPFRKGEPIKITIIGDAIALEVRKKDYKFEIVGLTENTNQSNGKLGPGHSGKIAGKQTLGKEGSKNKTSTAEKIAEGVADIGTDFVPGVSNVKDAYIAITGRNPVTGEEVGTAGRIASAIFAIPFLGNVFKWIGKGGKLAGKLISKTWKGLKKAGGKIKKLWKRMRRGKPPHTKLSQPGGLKATEGTQIVKTSGQLGAPSHVLASHGPDVPLNKVRQRVVNGKPKATKFTDRAKMETAIHETKGAKKVEIDNWLSSNPPAGANKAFDHSPGMGSLGEGFHKTNTGSIEKLDALENIRIVLKSDGAGSYVLQSAFPY